MNQITLHIQLFGAFREYGESVELTVPEGSGAQVVRDALAQELGMSDKSLITDSALASENSVLDEQAIFEQDAKLAILPPVCGG